MRKQSASGVLASLRGSPYSSSTIRFFARCGLAGRQFCASCGESAPIRHVGRSRSMAHTYVFS
ncbi:MAG: hypothetical protein E6R14_04610 [Thermomicrobiales bacterium]|nr:MAG: hypothetical protein E6R14_04610 [Thermomicrobiales bacterium]